MQVSRPVFDTWLAGTRATSLEGSVLLIEAPNPFVVESIEKRMYQTVLKAVHSVAGDHLEVRFYVSSVDDTPVSALDMPVTTEPSPRPSLNDQYTFANFIVGPSNQLAASAAQAVAEAPGGTYNPLFIYASPGLGKTHLMHAIAHAAHLKGANVRYVTSEHFTNEFIQGIRTKSTEDFRTRYRSVDILLVDDIQFLQGKEQTLEGFFHTFNDLHTSRKQVVLASELPPQRLTFLENKLRSRLESGLVAYLQVPDPVTRLSILQAKSNAIGVRAEPSALEILANPDVSNIRELEGHFTRAVALATLRNSDITLEIASEALEVVGKPRPTSDRPSTTPERVISSILYYYGITYDDLRGRRRSQKLLSARQSAIHIMSSELRMGVTEIARAIGRDHSTVSLAVKRLSHSLSEDSVLQADIIAINQMLIQ